MKTTNPLASLFGKSPFGPIQQHMRIVEQCVSELIPLFEALAVPDMDRVRACKDTIFRLEHEADEIKNGVRSNLPASFLMPVGRRDLLDLLTTQDAIAGAAQHVAGLLSMGKLRMPAALHDGLMAFVRKVVDAVKICRSAVDELDELLESGFRGRDAEKVLRIAEQVDAIETEADRQGMGLVRVLFDHEAEIGPLSVVFWYEAVRTLGSVADEAENVGDRLRLLLAR
jgi:uncharacterized protein